MNTQEERALDLLAELPWADVDAAIRGMEECLRLALEATGESFRMREEGAEENGFGDEFSLTQTLLDEPSPEWPLAYVARLLRSLALNYGVSAEFGGGPLVREAAAATPAAILRELNDISWIPLTTEQHAG